MHWQAKAREENKEKKKIKKKNSRGELRERI